MIKALLSWVIGGGMSSVASQLRGAYKDRLAAHNDSQRIEADQRIAQLEARQKVLMAGGKTSAVVQAAWAFPFIVYNAKLIIWDKVLGWGVTDPLSAELYHVQMIIVGFYFLSRVFK